MERNWTKAGEPEWTGHQDDLVKAFGELEWQPIPTEMSLSGGLAAKSMIKECRIPRVTHAAESSALAPYGLIAVRGHYKNGMVQAYGLDKGSELVMLCSEFFPNPPGPLSPA